MDVVMGDLFGSLGGLLTVFIVAVCALAIPLGIYIAMKHAVKFSQEQDRQAALKREHEGHGSH